MSGLARPPAHGFRRARQQDRGPRVEYLAFSLAGEPYAAPVGLIREILKPPPLTPVPRAASAIRGIVSVRGQLVTVIDLRRRLRLAEAPPSRKTRILLIEGHGGETLGLWVDEVLQVYRFSESEIEHAAVALGNDVAPYIAGIARPGQGRAASAEGSVPGRPTAQKPAVLGARESSGEPDVIILLDLRAVLA